MMLLTLRLDIADLSARELMANRLQESYHIISPPYLNPLESTIL